MAWLIKRQKSRQDRLQELLLKNYNRLTFDEQIELISCKYYEKKRLTYEEFVCLAMTGDEIEFFLKNTLYQIDHGLPEITAMYITKFKDGKKVNEKSINYDSIIELFDQFKIDGKKIRELWDDISSQE